MGASGSSPTTVWAPGMESQWILPASTSPERRFRRTRTCTTFPFDNNDGELFVQRLSLTGQSLYFTIAGGPGEGFGNGHDVGNGIALDDLHNAWAVGPPFTGRRRRHRARVARQDRSRWHEARSARIQQRRNDVGMGVAVAAVSPGLRDRPAGRLSHYGWSRAPPDHCAVFVLHQDEAGNNLMGMIFGGLGADDGGTAIVTNGSNAAFVTGFTTTPSIFRGRRSA